MKKVIGIIAIIVIGYSIYIPTEIDSKSIYCQWDMGKYNPFTICKEK